MGALDEAFAQAADSLDLAREWASSAQREAGRDEARDGLLGRPTQTNGRAGGRTNATVGREK